MKSFEELIAEFEANQIDELHYLRKNEEEYFKLVKIATAFLHNAISFTSEITYLGRYFSLIIKIEELNHDLGFLESILQEVLDDFDFNRLGNYEESYDHDYDFLRRGYIGNSLLCIYLNSETLSECHVKEEKKHVCSYDYSTKKLICN